MLVIEFKAKRTGNKKEISDMVYKSIRHNEINFDCKPTAIGFHGQSNSDWLTIGYNGKETRDLSGRNENECFVFGYAKIQGDPDDLDEYIKDSNDRLLANGFRDVVVSRISSPYYDRRKDFELIFNGEFK